MYSIRGYAAMIHDARRVEAYQRALQLVVTTDSVVVDIGTGLGIFALLACQAGARKVYAIEPAEVIAVARELAKANGYLERIEFIEEISSRVALPELADVIVSDLSGAEERRRGMASDESFAPRRSEELQAAAPATQRNVRDDEHGMSSIIGTLNRNAH